MFMSLRNIAGARLAGLFLAGAALAGLLVKPLPAGAQASEVTDILAAVVAVESRVPADARTAATLGTERAGSGVVIDASGLIVTIGYLILEASEVTVTTLGQSPVPATVIGYDHATGFGLLRASRALDVKPMPLGQSDEVAEFEPLLVTAYGGAGAVRPAVAVSRRQFAGYWEYLLDGAIFTSPPYPMFGGAALLNSDGQLVGIGSLVVGDAMQGERTLPGNMFVPIDALKPILGDLLAEGGGAGRRQPWIGVFSQELEGQVQVQRVAEDGPAAQAGIEPGDLIAEVDGDAVTTLANFYRRLWRSREPGDPVSITLLRDGQRRTVEVKTGDRYAWLKLGKE